MKSRLGTGSCREGAVMKRLMEFLWRTLVGGIVFVVPFILALILLREGLHVVGKLLGPVARRLPFDSAMGIAASDLVAAAALLVLGFIAGLLAQTTIGDKLGRSVEHLILRKMPG